jgi:bifunctional DNA-binding transcriptional regulator/antitoxin component of YhaV-PrlF toxin-antitoxin module
MDGMEKIGTKTIDELGRILLTREIRARFGWGERDTLDMFFVDNNTLMLQLAVNDSTQTPHTEGV